MDSKLYSATLLATSGRTTAIATVMAAGRRVLVSREVQATVPAFSLGTQCPAPARFVSSAACQTGDDGSPGAESDGSSLDASFKVRCGNPAFRGGGDGAVDALEEQHSSAYGATHYSAPVFEAGESSSHISLPPDAAAALSAQAQALLAQQRQFFNDREATQLERSLQAFQPCLQRNSQTAHSAVTEKAGPHVCLVCNKHFLWKGNLQTHMRQHTGEKPFACRFCPECYTRKYSLQQHERTHTGVKPYTCTVCHKSFSRKASLIKHDTTHSGERPFACSVCDKRFAHKSDQARHVRVHTGERPYVCKVCDKKFSQRSSLAAHEKTHGTHKHYTCNVCDKQFFYRWSFAMHERMHSGERPHVCGFCQRSFAYKNALVKHEQRLHAVIKPFECTTCETGLLAREQFVAHMKLHALQKPKNLEVVLASGAWGTDE
ncbi:uncharacterized protein LOC144142385 isoform X4 [Haemaphysalis longicornis]